MRTLLAAVTLFGLLAAPSAAATKTVALRGTAYEFNAPNVIPGATIRVAEFPAVRTTTKANGSYLLKVPNSSRVTPYIQAVGYHTIYLQTFITRGDDLQNVNFQTPSNDTYQALAALLNVPLDANGDVAQCAIVSTFSTRNIRDLNYRQFRAYGAHGIAGATAFGVPQLPDPVYFNAQVIPDPSQPSSSDDGGVIWTKVPTGTYAIHGRSPTTKFASFTATCEPGRVVNANPPWGLSQLGKENPTRVAASWSVEGSRTTLQSLRITRTPPDSTVRVRCVGRGCSARPKAGSTLRPGQILEVRSTAPKYNGTVVEFPIRAAKTPRPRSLCVPLGTNSLQPTCPSA